VYETKRTVLPAAPTSLVALLVASLLGLSLVVLGARDPSRERLALLFGLALAGYGAAGVTDVAFDLGLYPIGPLVAAAALSLGGAAMLARARA